MTPALLRRMAGLLTVAAALITLVGCSGGGGGTVAPSAATAAPTVAQTACPTSQPPALAAGETRTVTMGTEKGTIVMKLEADLSPIAVGNFTALVACGYYDGVGFHRVVTGFVIQGGDPDGTGTGGPGYEIKDEPVTGTYQRGTVAMARTAEPDSVGSQFFIVVDDEAQGALAAYNTYQIIGSVTSGMDVVDIIVDSAGGLELPADPVKMTVVTVANP